VRILVYVEARNGALGADSLGLLRRAAELADTDAFLGGEGVRELASQAAAHGAARVAVADGADTSEPLPQPHIEALLSLCESNVYDAIFFAATVLASDVAGGLAARLEAGVNWDLKDVENRDGELVGLRLALGDAVLVEVGWTTAVRIACFRPGVFEADPTAVAASAEIVDVDAAIPAHALATRRLSAEQGHGAQFASLADAAVIVSGGRGLRSKDNLHLISELADALGGMAAVSMPLVSAGWAPYSMQVGQTGSIVRPRLYVACGISGQMQHKVGMERSETIVAINTDESAPIFRFCDLAVVADVAELLPKLTAVVRERAGANGQRDGA
jgi:electron transfer flavoprotein alpha subunit